MKIFTNILSLISMYKSIKNLNQFKKPLEKAKAEGNIEIEKEYILKVTDTWGKDIVKRFGINLVIKGSENIPTKGPVVYAANHQGYADIAVCTAVLNKIQFGFIAKENLAKLPFFGKWIYRIRSVTMNREDARASLKAIEEGICLIKQGYSILIFPEGTRSKGGPMNEFKKGSLRLATKTGVPVIPITIDGTYKVFEEDGYVKKGQTVIMTIHKAIETKNLEKREQNELAHVVEDIVKSGLQ